MKIAFALEAEAEFEALFPPRPVKTLDDVVGRPVRQRARRKKARTAELDHKLNSTEL